jgi:hypothetical protein
MLANAPVFVGAETEKHKDLTILEGIRGVIFPYGSSVELTGPLAGGKTPQGAKLWKLAASSKEGWQHTGFFVMSVEALKKLEVPKERSSIPFGYAYEGKLKSAFAPAAPVAESSPDKPASESPRPVRLVVIGDSDFANDEFFQLSRFLPFYGAGAQMLVNAISWTVEDEALTPLRAKTVTPRPIQVSSEAKATALQWANVLGLPLAFCVFGVARWRIRRLARLGQKL